MIRGYTVAAALCALLAAPAGAAEPIKIGVLYTAGTGPVFIAKEKGYFAAEGLDAELVRFDAGQPVAVATVSGAIDFGAAGITSALYTLASQNAVRLIAGLTYDSPGFHGSAIVTSNKAAADGLRTIEDLPGHSVGLTQIGSTFEYAIAIVSEKHGVDIHSLHFVPFQSLANVASAVAGGAADAGVLVAPLALPLTERDGAKLLAWVGDETPWQVAAVWTSTRTANERPKIVQAFLSALRKGSHDYHDAFIAGGSAAGPKDGPGAAQLYPVLQKYLGQSMPEIKASLGDVDPDNRLDAADIERQIDWFHGEGMVRGDVDAATVIDKRYVIPMPGR